MHDDPERLWPEKTVAGQLVAVSAEQLSALESELAALRQIVAAYRAEEVREAIGHVREVIDAYRREAVARGDRKTIAWIDRCLKAMERREENP